MTAFIRPSTASSPVTPYTYGSVILPTWFDYVDAAFPNLVSTLGGNTITGSNLFNGGTNTFNGTTVIAGTTFSGGTLTINDNISFFGSAITLSSTSSIFYTSNSSGNITGAPSLAAGTTFSFPTTSSIQANGSINVYGSLNLESGAVTTFIGGSTITFTSGCNVSASSVLTFTSGAILAGDVSLGNGSASSQLNIANNSLVDFFSGSTLQLSASSNFTCFANAQLNGAATFGGAVYMPTKFITSNYTVDSSGQDFFINCNSGSGSITITLPNANNAGRILIINGGTNATSPNVVIVHSVSSQDIVVQGYYDNTAYGSLPPSASAAVSYTIQEPSVPLRLISTGTAWVSF